MKPDSLNIRHLRLLLNAYGVRTLSEAAEQTHVTQPAASQAITQLERALKCVFFHRDPHGIRPAPCADLFVPRIKAALDYLPSKKMTMAQVRAFLALAETGSYAAAAAHLSLSSPSVHRAVRELSLITGTAIVGKRGQAISITPEGRRFVRRCRLALSEIRAGLSDLKSAQGDDTGMISIGAMPLSRARVLPAAIAQFHAAHNSAELHITEGSHKDLIEPLRDGALDLLVGALRVPSPGADVVQEPLFEDRPVVLARAGHPLTKEPTVTAQHLAAYEWVLPAKSTPLRAQWEQIFMSDKTQLPPVPIESGSALLIRQLLRKTDLLTLLSADQVGPELDAHWLKVIAPAPQHLVRNIGLTYRADWRPTQLQTHFLSALRSAAAATSS